MTSYFSLLLIVVGMGVSMIGDVFLKRSIAIGDLFFAFGALSYTAATIPITLAFRRTDFGALFIVYEALTVIVALVIASTVFAEPLHAKRLAALALALSALYLGR